MADQTISLDSSLQTGFVLQVKIYVSRSKVDDFLALFKPVYDRVVAEKECQFFVVGVQQESPLEPSSTDDCICINWTEGWSETIEWFMNVQFKKDYYPEYFKETEKLFVKPREIQFLTPQTGMNQFKAP